MDPSRATTGRIPYAALKASQTKLLTTSFLATQHNRAIPTPKGFQPLTETLENETFDWNSVEQNLNLELWAVRIPKGVRRPSRLPECCLTDALPFSRPPRILGYIVAPEKPGWLNDHSAFFPPGSFDYSACPL